MNYIWPSLITGLAIAIYTLMTAFAGSTRAAKKVVAPSVTGDLDFEKRLRVQQNTLEQLMLFLPSLWLFAVYVSSFWATIIGCIWLAGRIAYALAYYNDPAKRGPGMMATFVSSITLLLGGLGGIVLTLLGLTTG